MISGDFSAVPITIDDPHTGQGFPGNIIPSEDRQVSKAFWDQYGYNIGYSDSHTFPFANARKVWNINGRLDFNVNQDHRLT